MRLNTLNKVSKMSLILIGLIFYSCSVTKPVTTNTETVVRYIDSLRVKDSTVIHTETRIKDYAIVPDTLKLVGQHSTATAFLDTAITAIKGSLTEDEWKEKIVYKDKIVERVDSLYIEKPVEVVIEKKVAPKWVWYSLGLNALFLIILALKIWLKTKGI